MMAVRFSSRAVLTNPRIPSFFFFFPFSGFFFVIWLWRDLVANAFCQRLSMVSRP